MGEPGFDQSAVVARYIFTRIALAAVMLGIALFWVAEQPWAVLTARVMFNVAAGTFVVMAISAATVRHMGTRSWFVPTQLAFDGMLVTVVSALTGGLESPYFALYTVNIVGAAWLAPRAAVIVAIYDAVLFSVVFGGQAFLTSGAVAAWGDSLLYTQFVLRVMALLLVGFLAGRLGTERASAALRLAEETERANRISIEHALVLDRVRTGILMVGADGIVRSQNPAAEALLGVVVGQPLTSAVEGKGPRWEQIRRRGDERLHLLCSRSPLDDGEELVVVEDVTRLRRVEAEMVSRERMAAVGRLAAGLAHEIRNPLASLSGSVQLLREANPGPLHEIILREVERLDRLVDDFLDMARPMRVEPLEVDIGDLAREVAMAFGNDQRFAGRIRVLIDDGGVGVVRIDPFRMRQVLWNLLLNAAQATPGASTIRIELLPRDDGGVVLRVVDQGIGIPPERLETIFDPFYTTRSGGTGLGLANVRRVVQAHGGAVEVRSEEGQGTTFTLTLPRVVTEAAEASHAV